MGGRVRLRCVGLGRFLLLMWRIGWTRWWRRLCYVEWVFVKDVCLGGVCWLGCKWVVLD